MTTDTPSDTTGHGLVAKLAHILAEMHWIPKRGWNDFHKYSYARESDVLEAIREHLGDAGIFIFSSVLEIQSEFLPGDEKKPRHQVTVRMLHTFVDASTGERFEVQSAGIAQDTGDKALYKATTGAMKYFLMKCFLLSTGDDPETDGATSGTHDARPKPAPPQRSTPAAPSPPAEGTAAFAIDRVQPKSKVESSVEKHWFNIYTIPGEYPSLRFSTFSESIAELAKTLAVSGGLAQITWTTSAGGFLNIKNFHAVE